MSPQHKTKELSLPHNMKEAQRQFLQEEEITPVPLEQWVSAESHGGHALPMAHRPGYQGFPLSSLPGTETISLKGALKQTATRNTCLVPQKWEHNIL